MSRRTILIIGFIALVGAIIAVVIPRQRRLIREAHAQAEHKRAQTYFNELKNGGKKYPAIDSPDLMSMIANDPDCARQLTYVHFDMTDLNASEFWLIQKLPNVKKISFYDCEGITTLLGHAANMPSVTEVHFDYIRPSDELLKRLASIPNLKRLLFNSMDNGELDQFKRALPDVQVEIYDESRESNSSLSGSANPTDAEGERDVAK